MMVLKIAALGALTLLATYWAVWLLILDELDKGENSE